MEEGEEEPFWISGDLRRRRRSAAMSSGVFLMILLVLAGLLVFVIVPCMLRLGKPNLENKSWDSLNLVLVAFAIVCGFLSRNSDGGGSDRRVEGDTVADARESTVEGGDRDGDQYGGFDRTVEDRGMRSSRSYSDLATADRRVEDRWSGNLTRMRSSRSYSDVGLVEPTTKISSRAIWLDKRNVENEYRRSEDLDNAHGQRNLEELLPPQARKLRRRKKKHKARSIEDLASFFGSPPPPPPPPSIFHNLFSPRKSIPRTDFEIPNPGNLSPPFRRQEDFVRINSERSASPDLDDSPAPGLFCPSPDVDTKADTFIARFRAGLNLENINSLRARSNLGPEPGPSFQ